MAKFEVELEVTGFKLRVKGDRGTEIPHLAQQVGQQIAGLLEPAANMVDPDAGPLFRQVDSVTKPVDQPKPDGNNKKRKPRGSRRANNSGDSTPPNSISWQHDPAKWGTPKQAWTAQQKITWILYVIIKETSQTEVSGPLIADTFNTRFKQFGPLKKK